MLAAWAACAEHDPAAEEAAAALVRGYFAAGHRELAVRAYERCRAALGELGLGLSPWLEEVYATAAFEAAPPRTQAPPREELRTVTVLAADVVADGLDPADPEELRDVAGRCLAAVIAEVEALGGTVTSVSGGGLQAMFGAPEAHEDDPERAALAAFRALASVASIDGGNLRIGVETGPAVLGPIGGGARVEYGAVGEVVGRAAALQALARPGSALVGPVTRAAAGHLFAWGAAEGDGTYLGPPMPRIAGHRLRRDLAAPHPRPGPAGRGPCRGLAPAGLGHRPAESAPALDGLDAGRLELGPLPGAAEEELARSLLGEGTNREVLDAVLSSADGNPLFLEERLSSLLEARALVRERGAWRLSRTAGAQVPQALERMVRSRVDETDLDNARRSLAAALDAEEKDVGYATFFLARFLLLHGDLAEAQDHLEHSLALAERIGETALRAYSLLGLAMAALRRHDIAEVRALLPRVLAEAETIAGPDYLAGAKAFLAWLAWLDRHPDDVIKLAEEIATLMTGTPDVGLYYGPVRLWPLAAVHLEAGHLAEAVAATRRLRDHSQLPADLEAALTAASRAWVQDQPGLARASLTAALDLARDLGYL